MSERLTPYRTREEIAEEKTKCDCEGYPGIAHDMLELQTENADLRRQLEDAQSYNKDWVERCRKFRASDAVEAEQQLAEVTAERDRLMGELERFKYFCNLSFILPFWNRFIKYSTKSALRQEET